MPQAGQFTKSHLYVKKLLELKLTHTKGGTPITVVNDGWGVETRTGRSRDGKRSYYLPIDYPQLFGWDRADFKPGPPTPPPMFIEHKGYEYKRIRSVK